MAACVVALAGCAWLPHRTTEPSRAARTSALLAPPPVVRYPDMLRSANIEGDAVVDLAVDTLGGSNRVSARVLKSSHVLFTAALKRAYRDAPWTSETMTGIRARGTWRDTIEFALVDSLAMCPAPRSHRRVVCGVRTPTEVWTGMSGVERAAWLRKLAEGRARWERERPSRYRVELIREAGMIAQMAPGRTLTTDVSNRAIVAVTTGRADSATSHVWLEGTIEEFFGMVERHLRTTGAQVHALDIDPRYGFPRRLHSDVPGRSESETDLQVLTFQTLP